MHALERPLSAEQMPDMLAIQNCLGRAVLGNDMLDEAMWKSAYWPDATEDHGWYQGNAHAFIDEALVMLERDMITTWHSVGTPIIVLDGEQARCVSYFTAYCRFKAAAGDVPDDLLSGGRYVDRLERRDGLWRITHRISKGDWIRVDPSSFEWGKPAMGGQVPRLGTRDHDDPARLLFGMAAAPCCADHDR